MSEGKLVNSASMASSSVSYNDSEGGAVIGSETHFGHSVFQENTNSNTAAVKTFLTQHFGKGNEDLKAMLDSSKDYQKLDAMRRIVSMLASGKDVSELFPAVVKNVVSKNIEIKKLVYVYLVRYGEEQQDLALLSIATFQRGLRDPNQLIRASALRVLSSIRVPVIVPIMMLALKEAVTDMSPYVRKTAANAIPKLYSLDPEQKDALIEIIEKLLQDKTTLVAGSTVIAFEVVCPERVDLIHKNYRKLCNMLIDIDEWGQVAVLNMLVRYARLQFLDPNKLQDQKADEKFYPSSEESENGDAGGEEKKEEDKEKSYVMDADHRLLLRCCKPLLQSRNAAVVMAVAKVYHHTAPASEVAVVIKAMVRLLRSHREVQSIVLSNIVTLSLIHKGLFDPHMRSFFVHASDPTHVKKLKLEILTNLATESNIPTILREFQSYIASSDKVFAATTIQAIGRCASSIPEVADTCLAGLIRLLSNRDDIVVSESVIVIKKLLQMNQKDHSEVISHMAKLIDKISVPMARASILWLIGEYSEKIPKVSPDVLRKMAKSFANEEDVVKLQIINMSAKLYISNSKQCRNLCQYILQLAKYDQNYDIRDRSRFVRFILFPEKTEGPSNLRKKAKKIFLAEKPAPVIQSLFQDRSAYQLASLSHVINARANGYEDLPDFPSSQPDPSVRNVEMEPVRGNQFLLSKEPGREKKPDKDFYANSSDESAEDSESGSGSSEEEEEGEGDGSDGNSDEEASADDEEVEEQESSEEEEDSQEESEFDELDSDDDMRKVVKKQSQSDESQEPTSNEEQDDDEESEEDSEEESKESEGDLEESDEEELSKPIVTKTSAATYKEREGKMRRNSYDQLLDLDDFSSGGTTTTVSNGSVLTPSLVLDVESLSIDPSTYQGISQSSNVVSMPTYELLNKMNGQGLSAEYRFTRTPSIYSRQMVGIEIEFKNQSNSDIKNIGIGEKRLSSGLEMQACPSIAVLSPGQSMVVSIGVDFKDTTQPANFDIRTATSKFAVSIKVPIGELMTGALLTEQEFISEQGKLAGMNESSVSCTLSSALASSDKELSSRVCEVANVKKIFGTTPPAAGGFIHRYSGKLISSGIPTLVTIKGGVDGKNSFVVVNCEKISIGSLLAKELKSALMKT